jgi:hypothetical protein
MLRPRLSRNDPRQPIQRFAAGHTARKKNSVLPLLALLSAIACGSRAADQNEAPASLASSYEYLVSYRDTHGGALYLPREGPLKGAPLPYSFTDSERYWGEYVCKLRSVNCAVSDYYDPADYAIKPRPGEGALLQTERINVHNGTNIYDAATWQIAVVLGSVLNHFGNSLDLHAYSLASNQNRVLGQVHDMRDVPTGRRATTAGALYVYNGTRITDPKSAYAFRMTAPAWLAPDPLRDAYAKLINVETLPKDNPRYQPGLVAWSDWKPITGDNAWAFFLGPLQAAYIHFVLGLRERFVPFADLSVQNAVAALPAFAAMESKCGGIYYAPAGTLQNAGDNAVDPHLVSIENNLSLFAGLRILRATLADELSGDKSLTPDQKALITRSTALIDTMLSGGTLPGDRYTGGLKEFLRSRAWRDGEFVQAGFADAGAGSEEWRPVLEPKAVDVNTWGVAALGARQIDSWFGFGAADRMWESLKHWGAYGEGRTLWGVGYSDRDGNGQTPEGVFRSGVLSAEWTAGAIVMLRNMIAYYSSLAPGSPAAARARDWVDKLRTDEQALIVGMQHLQFSRYIEAGFPGKPPDYANLIAEPKTPTRSDPYLYSSRRYRVPFGWYGNPLPSTSSTAWAILVADHYDPFGYGGKPN